MTRSRKTRGMFLRAVLACLLILSMAVNASATEYTKQDKKDSYNVAFKTESGKKKMVSDFSSKDMYYELTNMQPGDSVDIVMNLKNENEDVVDWYMTNDVLSSLEDTRNAENLANGAYTYILTYASSDTGNSRTLYNSDTVGGEDGSTKAGEEGLHEATDALADWIYLDTFDEGQGGVLTLTVGLEGETQGNDYQDTLAELQMRFAVELNTTETNKKNKSKSKNSSSSSSSTRNKVVRTGDPMDSVPYLIAAAISGILLLLLAIYSLRQRRRQRGGGQ